MPERNSLLHSNCKHESRFEFTATIPSSSINAYLPSKAFSLTSDIRAEWKSFGRRGRRVASVRCKEAFAKPQLGRKMW